MGTSAVGGAQIRRAAPRAGLNRAVTAAHVRFPATLPIAMNSAAIFRFLDHVCEPMPNKAEADRNIQNATEVDRAIRKAVETARALRKVETPATAARHVGKPAKRPKPFRAYISPVLAGLAVLVLAQIVWSMLFIASDSAQPLQDTVADAAPVQRSARLVAAPVASPQIERIYLGHSQGTPVIADAESALASPEFAADKPSPAKVASQKPTDPIARKSTTKRFAGEMRTRQTAEVLRPRTLRPKAQPQTFTSFSPLR